MNNKELVVGIGMMILGIALLFFEESKTIAPFLIGFSVVSVIRGARS